MFVYLNIAASILLLSVELSNKDSDIVLLLQLFLLSIHIATQCKKSHKFSNVFAKGYLHLLDKARKLSRSTKILYTCIDVLVVVNIFP